MYKKYIYKGVTTTSDSVISSILPSSTTNPSSIKSDPASTLSSTTIFSITTVSTSSSLKNSSENFETQTTASQLTTTKSIPVSTACVSHYWPVANKAVEDVIGDQSAASNGSPRFAKNRFGVADGALRIFSKGTTWWLPPGSYIKGDTTLTMWLKKIECKHIGPYGLLKFFI
jgi:hypothetical protein